MPVRMLFDLGQRYSGRAFRDCIHEASTHGVTMVLPQRGYHWSDDAMLHYNNFHELFMGDAGESSEARILTSGIDLRADVLKVGHHGSKYASMPPFVAAVHPQAAIVSVGRHNTFGHPGPSTLETLDRVGAKVYRTDYCGAATLDVRVVTTMLKCKNP